MSNRRDDKGRFYDPNASLPEQQVQQINVGKIIAIAAAVGFLFGAIVIAVVFFLIQGKQPNPVAITQPSPTPLIVAVQPSATMEAVVATDTDLPPTSTPIPPTNTTVPPTDTPLLPTDTPLPPSPTQPLDTPAGSVLDVGQTWKQGGLEISLETARVTTTDYYFSQGIVLHIVIRNNKPNEITFSYSQDNLSAINNKGDKLDIERGFTYLGHIDPQNIHLGIGQSVSISDDGATEIVILANVADPSVTEVIFAINGVSSVQNAKWRIPIYH